MQIGSRNRVAILAVVGLAAAGCSLRRRSTGNQLRLGLIYLLGNFYTSGNLVAQHQWLPYLTNGVPNDQIENTLVHSGESEPDAR